jgi:hypothetical protein
MKPRFIARLGVLLATAVLTALVIPTLPAFADDGPGCDNGFACTWSSEQYNGNKTKYTGGDCCQWISTNYSSVKNRFGDRVVKIRPTIIADASCVRPDDSFCCTLSWLWIRVKPLGDGCND